MTFRSVSRRRKEQFAKWKAFAQFFSHFSIYAHWSFIIFTFFFYFSSPILCHTFDDDEKRKFSHRLFSSSARIFSHKNIFFTPFHANIDSFFHFNKDQREFIYFHFSYRTFAHIHFNFSQSFLLLALINKREIHFS